MPTRSKARTESNRERHESTESTQRKVSWVKPAKKVFERFPKHTREDVTDALTAIAGGEMPENTKPLKGFDAGVYEIIEKGTNDTYRIFYSVKIGEDLWVFHAFQKKSKKGISTPKKEIDTAKSRLKDLRELLKWMSSQKKT